MSQHVCPQELQGSCQFNTNRQHLLHRFPKCHVVFLKKKGKLSQEDEANTQGMDGAGGLTD